jgi:hypothetical protein
MNSKLFEAIYETSNSAAETENTYLESPLDTELKPPMLMEEIYFECNVKPLFEQVLKESPTGIATGGTIGQQAKQVYNKDNNKTMLEILQIATTEVMKTREITPEKKIVEKDIKEITCFFGLIKKTEEQSKTKYINILNISDKNKKQQELNKWIAETITTFISIFSTVKNISQEDIQTITNYFTNIENLQPMHNMHTSDGTNWH